MVFLIFSVHLFGQHKENVILITLDGLRWQELFTGADVHLIADPEYVKDSTHLKDRFWRATAEERRAALMPFFWGTLAKKGQIYGNRAFNNKVNLTNNHWFSYPGYSEILCGYADDDRIYSNDKIDNPNTTILEFFNNKKHFKGKVAAFGSWDVFPYIINEKRSRIPVNAGFENATIAPTEKEQFLNELQAIIPSPWHNVRLDAFTHLYMKEYLQKEKPRLVYISYGETDDFAHDGKYDAYLSSAFRTDQFIEDLWQYLQSDAFYANKTTLIITTDHGRGASPKENWQHHGNKLRYMGRSFSIEGADQTWIAIIGPDSPALGEVKTNQQLYASQIAATVAKALGVNYKEKKAGKPIAGAMND